MPSTPATNLFENADWIRLEIPTGREAYAIAGDIDQTLLVTTWTKAYYSSDRGKTWQVSKDFQGPIPGLYVRNDTTFALHARRYNREGSLLGAWDALYYSPDYGKSWEWYSKTYKNYLDEVKPIATIRSTNGIVYTIKQNSTPTAPGSNVATVNPSVIIRQEANTQNTIRFPFQHNLMNLYLDGKNRLYVAASGGTYQPETNSFFCCTDAMPAVVYVSKRPLP
ncbi:hypothetical protein [Fibrella aestuarina]|uniref:hypothetical protein n=1 Tax=Fibrella aestuarina TaxID=651143 RepID=UPI00031053EA|nr:hypothetical protein [Fibrella aestuarina]